MFFINIIVPVNSPSIHLGYCKFNDLHSTGYSNNESEKQVYKNMPIP